MCVFKLFTVELGVTSGWLSRPNPTNSNGCWLCVSERPEKKRGYAGLKWYNKAAIVIIGRFIRSIS